MRDLLNAAGRRDPASVRFLVSAHASLEELFLVKRVATELKGDARPAHVAVTWRRSAKSQPADTKFVIPATDAPNVTGARDLGLAVGAGLDGTPDLSGLRAAVEAGTVEVLYVVDPGPAESLGDVAWVLEAKAAGKIKALVYQGVLTGAMASAADVVLPGAAWVEKDGCFTNDQGMLQAASKAIVTPGEAVEDWQILTSVAAALGLPFSYESSAAVRVDLAQALAGQADLRDARRADVQPSGERGDVAAGVESVRALEVGRDVSGPAAGEGAQRADGTRGQAVGDSAAPRHRRTGPRVRLTPAVLRSVRMRHSAVRWSVLAIAVVAAAGCCYWAATLEQRALDKRRALSAATSDARACNRRSPTPVAR